MKHAILRSIVCFGASVMLSATVSAQEPKVKTGDHETKYKSEDLKIKEEDKETKIKGVVKPMQIKVTERTETKSGKTKVESVKTTEAASQVETSVPPVTERGESVSPPAPAMAKKSVSSGKKYNASKTSHMRKRTAARKTHTARKYVVRTKIVRDTVYVPSPPETVVNTQYVHDTVLITRIDTVVRMQTKNSYTGYRVPRGDFKKVKLKKDGNEVEMKRKLKNGKKMNEHLE